ncbi:acyl CoA:acetate/3-ketoacid CoA transferase [Neobacillus sp. MER 74]|uniref:acyl CoA:acetate/3-ketoacid CoA transferase n=1 Tax=Neobacillus sp. MER 74 TaxID=2939566 RepID=UPI00203ACBB7|nr:CoA-transferase [Neobacillus sp. MER 74]MCM3113763.1 acyl CoA:acetate/3-ketoacid CoA transferase [Neobacillus sp. MER 74]
MDKVMKAEEVLPHLKEGAVLSTVGFTLMGACGTILNEIEKSFLETGYPKNLTLLHGAGQSDRINGIQRLAHPGLVKRIIGSHWGLAPKWGEMIHNNEVEAFCLPQGQLVHLFRAMASGKPGNFSKVGVGTFVDPRIEGGKMNVSAQACDDILEVLSLNGEEYLFYKSHPIDVAIIRGTTADERGNITMEEEAIKLEAISVAQAAKSNGGKVFAQVKYLAKSGSLHPKDIVVPGIYVDGIIISENQEEDHRQTASYFFDPVYSGDLKIPVATRDPYPFNIRKIIGRRAVMELFPNAVVNLGTGIPGDVIGPIANEERINKAITLTIESGVIGGIPEGGTDFGITKNAEAIIEHCYQFDYYNGSGVDVTFMGMAEVDSAGNVNVSKFGTKTVGCGGFIDITQPAKKVVFCATFTAGGLKVDIEGETLRVIQEGRTKKFIDEVNQITFSGKYARDIGQRVIFVTERAVFELRKDGLVLTEIAPGIDLEIDILAHMDFKPIIAADLKMMDSRIFRDEVMEFENEFFGLEKSLLQTSNSQLKGGIEVG